MSDLLARTLTKEFKEFDFSVSERQEYYLRENRIAKWKRVLRKWKK